MITQGQDKWFVYYTNVYVFYDIKWWEKEIWFFAYLKQVVCIIMLRLRRHKENEFG